MNGNEKTWQLDEITRKKLISLALKMRERSYVPYSGFAVGAALLTEDGEIFSGCNIENGVFSETVCAERTAIFKAVSEGKRSFAAIAVAGGKAGAAPEDYCPPCGVCRQVMTEFCDPSFPILLVKSEQDVKDTTLAQLLPLAFRL